MLEPITLFDRQFIHTKTLDMKTPRGGDFQHYVFMRSFNSEYLVVDVLDEVSSQGHIYSHLRQAENMWFVVQAHSIHEMEALNLVTPLVLVNPLMGPDHELYFQKIGLVQATLPVTPNP